MKIIHNQKGLNGIEITVTLALVLLLLVISAFSLNKSKQKTRDQKRKTDVSQIGRLMIKQCFLPAKGGGEYDISQIIEQLKKHDPQQARYLIGDLKDPSAKGEESLYKYRVDSRGEHCVIYANLENKNEQVTLNEISKPTLGGKTGVFEAVSKGWNGSKKYYQMSR
jgi:type II secretory pathway pseudopilin PulG